MSVITACRALVNIKCTPIHTGFVFLLNTINFHSYRHRLYDGFFIYRVSTKPILVFCPELALPLFYWFPPSKLSNHLYFLSARFWRKAIKNLIFAVTTCTQAWIALFSYLYPTHLFLYRLKYCFIHWCFFFLIWSHKH